MQPDRSGDSSGLAARVHARLLARGETGCSAESLTGGALADLLSSTPGASESFRGGVVAYATEVKRSLLGVTAELVVSQECAEQMAIGVRRLLGADWAVSTTGVAGPTEQDGQPVGTVFLAVAGSGGTSVRRLALAGDRTAIRSATCAAALEALLDAVG
jgi:nicotinamide-nucleotide amidase